MDVALDDTGKYTDILWNGIQAEKVQRAFEKLTELLVAEGAIHAVRLKQKSKIKRKKKIAAATSPHRMNVAAVYLLGANYSIFMIFQSSFTRWVKP